MKALRPVSVSSSVCAGYTATEAFQDFGIGREWLRTGVWACHGDAVQALLRYGPREQDVEPST